MLLPCKHISSELVRNRPYCANCQGGILKDSCSCITTLVRIIRFTYYETYKSIYISHRYIFPLINWLQTSAGLPFGTRGFFAEAKGAQTPNHTLPCKRIISQFQEKYTSRCGGCRRPQWRTCGPLFIF